MKHFITIIFCCATFASMAQATLKIGSGATLGLGSANLVLENTDLENNGTLTANTSNLKLSGSSDSNLDLGGTMLNNLILDKSPGTTVTLLANAGVSNEVTFNTDDVKLVLGAYDFSFGPSANVVSADGNEYFVTNGTGRVSKQGLGASGFTFHVGQSLTTYNPVILNENGPSDTYGVRCLASVLSNGNSGSAATSQVADAAWEVVEGSAGDANLSVTAQWSHSDELVGFDRTDCTLGRYSGGVWDFASTPTGAATGSNPYSFTRTGLNGPGIFGVGMATALPIELVDFQVFATSKTDAMLSWQTASEQQMDHFEVERLNANSSLSDWNLVGVVEAVGESQNLQTYALPDPGVGRQGGSFYYRLKMVELDGSHEYSQVEELSFEGQVGRIIVFPNPTTWGVFVQFGEAETAAAKLYAVDGRLLQTALLSSELDKINFLPGLLPGVYLLALETESGSRQTVRVVVAGQ